MSPKEDECTDNREETANDCEKAQDAYTRAGLLSMLFFTWLTPLLDVGYKRSLQISDLYQVPEQDTSKNLSTALGKEWQNELVKMTSGTRPSLRKAVQKVHGLKTIGAGFIALFGQSLRISQSLLLSQLLQYFVSGSTTTTTQACMYVVGLVCTMFVYALADQVYYFVVQKLGMRLRVACCSLLYAKLLRLSNASLMQTTTGQIVNIMSNDVNRFDLVTLYVNYLWIFPLEVIAVGVLVWYLVGFTGLAGFLVVCILVPLQAVLGHLFNKFRAQVAKLTDERVRMMNEFVQSIRLVKMYCWEHLFGKLVGDVRRKEVKKITSSLYVNAVVFALLFGSSKLMLYAAFITHALLTGTTMTSDVVFPLLMLFDIAQMSFFYYLPIAVRYASETLVSFRRVEDFLLLEELEEDNSTHSKLQNGLKTCKIVAKNVCAVWEKDLSTSILNTVDFLVGSGELWAVIGAVGSGKSSLLRALLRELPLSDGSVQLSGQVAYTSQEPWIFSGTIRENILFGRKLNSEQYSTAVYVSGLQLDIDRLPEGDRTPVGERGVVLSGGQQARVCLARAVYAEADVYLLDDPLSAVDAAIGRHIFDNCICGLLKNKTRMLVTHQLQYLEAVDKIIVLQKGKVSWLGSYSELLASGNGFTTFLPPQKSELIATQAALDIDDSDVSTEAITSTATSDRNTRRLSNFHCRRSSSTQSIDAYPIAGELRSEGSVNVSVYRRYLCSGSGVFGLLLACLLNVGAHCCFLGTDVWLAYCLDETTQPSNHSSRNMTTSHPSQSIPFDTKLGVLSGIVIMLLLLSIAWACWCFRLLLRSAQNLHNRMFESVVRSPLAFFKKNAVGTILNRFSKDMGQVDEILAVTMYNLLTYSVAVVAVVLVAVKVNPWVILPTAPILTLFMIYRRFYLRSSTETKRLEGITRSPVFSHITSSVQGLQTIRAFRVQQSFVEGFDQRQDIHTSAWLLCIAGNRWLALRLELLCTAFVACVAAASIIAAQNLNGGMVGLTLSTTIGLSGLFQWCVRQSAQVENLMTSAERIVQYGQLPAEAPLTTSTTLPADWPQKGIIACSGANLKYSDTGPDILKDAEFHINSREKVGIVGRTAAGKSSLTAMLFRLYEPTGRIQIDGEDILQLGLHQLRDKITIIQQDPVLFAGRLRNNLDPFSQYTDEQLWTSLSEVQMKKVIHAMTGGLDANVSEEGANFSVGQKQLICLARALLKKNKILILDEATSNVDNRTDALIQETIRQQFNECTVLTIAHRLHTVIDSDRIMVMDNGRIVQFDEPYLMLQDKSSVFRELVYQLGGKEADDLVALAKRIYEEKHSANTASTVTHAGMANLHKHRRNNMPNDENTMPICKPIPASNLEEEEKGEEEECVGNLKGVKSACYINDVTIEDGKDGPHELSSI